MQTFVMQLLQNYLEIGNVLLITTTIVSRFGRQQTLDLTTTPAVASETDMLPLAFICQFRLRSFRVAFKSLQFMCKYMWEEHIYGDRSKLSESQAFRELQAKRWVEVMVTAVFTEASAGMMRKRSSPGIFTSSCRRKRNT